MHSNDSYRALGFGRVADLTDEVAILRDELAKAKDVLLRTIKQSDALRAELAESREAGDNALADIAALRAERDEWSRRLTALARTCVVRAQEIERIRAEATALCDRVVSRYGAGTHGDIACRFRDLAYRATSEQETTNNNQEPT